MKSYEWLMDVVYRKKLAEAVKRARGERSQREFGLLLGVSYAAVRTWEKQESLPGLENLELIAEYLGLTLEEFLTQLRGDEVEKADRAYEKAEDVLPLANRLPRSERVRLIHLMLDGLGE